MQFGSTFPQPSELGAAVSLGAAWGQLGRWFRDIGFWTGKHRGEPGSMWGTGGILPTYSSSLKLALIFLKGHLHMCVFI